MLADPGGAYSHRGTFDDPNREGGAPQPGIDPPLVTGDLDPGDAGAGAFAGGVRDALVARDEEREERLAHRLGEARQMGAQPLSRDRAGADSEAFRVRRYLVHRDR